MSNTLNAASVSYRSMNSTDNNFKKMSKKLIDDKKTDDDPEDLDNTNITYTSNNTTN